MVTILLFPIFSEFGIPCLRQKIALGSAERDAVCDLKSGIFVVSRSPYSEVTKQLRTVVASAP